jgi:hypothetical protein
MLGSSTSFGFSDALSSLLFFNDEAASFLNEEENTSGQPLLESAFAAEAGRGWIQSLCSHIIILYTLNYTKLQKPCVNQRTQQPL